MARQAPSLAIVEHALAVVEYTLAVVEYTLAVGVCIFLLKNTKVYSSMAKCTLLWPERVYTSTLSGRSRVHLAVLEYTWPY